MSKGLIIYFDGPDGSGKTTQLEKVAQSLRDDGRPVHLTRVLGGSQIGDLLAPVLLSDIPRPVETDLHVALACHHASRDDLVQRRDQGEIVLVDRSPLSIIAYQVHGDGLDKDTGYQAAESIFGLIYPDLTLLYTAPQEVLEERRRVRNKGGDYFEHKDSAYHGRVIQGYKEAAARFNAVVIDADGDVDHVHDATMQHVRAVLDALTKE